MKKFRIFCYNKRGLTTAIVRGEKYQINDSLDGVHSYQISVYNTIPKEKYGVGFHYFGLTSYLLCYSYNVEEYEEWKHIMYIN